MSAQTPEDDERDRLAEFDSDPPHPDGFPGSDEGSHYMSQTRFERLTSGGRTEAEDRKLRETLGTDPTEARELLTAFLDRYPEMRRWIREPVIHELKTWTSYYDAVEDGRKTFEIRKDDRGFHVGDILRLREWDRNEGKYTGRQLDVVVTYITTGEPLGILKPFHICMSIRRLT